MQSVARTPEARKKVRGRLLSPPAKQRADPLIDRADYGLKAATVRTLFAELREKLVPLVQAITDRHGGQVTMRSRVKQGTVVTMKLPAGEVTNP